MITAPSDLQLESSQSQGYDEIDIQQIINALSRRWRLIAGGGVLGILIAGILNQNRSGLSG